MNTVLWLALGAVLGWAAFSALDLNLQRGRIISIVIGAMGGMLGGKVIAPMFLGAAVPEEFSFVALLFAAFAAAACLALGNLVQNRWGI